jgi:hypothetical protein
MKCELAYINRMNGGFKNCEGGNMAGAEGVEPSHTDPESAVLPLDDAPTTGIIIACVVICDNNWGVGGKPNFPSIRELKKTGWILIPIQPVRLTNI